MSDGLWQAVLGEIEITVSHANFITWFKHAKLLEVNPPVAVIGVTGVFAKRQMEAKYKDLILSTLKKNGAEIDKVDFRVIESSKRQAQTGRSGGAKASATQRTQNNTSTSLLSPPSSLNAKYTFDTFIVGANNELAYAAAQAIARSPGTKYNPFLVYGGVGLGKTHLIQAVGNAITKQNNEAHVEYISSETFVNEFIGSILSKKKLSNKYRGADVLIIDDIQFIAGKERTQEEFFHIFNALHQANKQIIMSSDRPPRDIPTLEERLRSRFEWGMTADISSPDYETRAAILQSKASDHNIRLDDEVVEYLANNVQSNIRELEGALTKLLAQCEVRNVRPSLEIAKQVVSGNGRRQTQRLTPRSIVDKTARYFNISLDEITGPKRDKEIVEPRQIAMYLLRSELKLSFPQIARCVGRKDHTTAIHSVDKIQSAIDENDEMRGTIRELKERLYA